MQRPCGGKGWGTMRLKEHLEEMPERAWPRCRTRVGQGKDFPFFKSSGQPWKCLKEVEDMVRKVYWNTLISGSQAENRFEVATVKRL